MNSELPKLLSRIRKHTDTPLAVGFGVATREHFDAVATAGADGVVIGSRLASVIKNAPDGQTTQAVEQYCREISLKGQPPKTFTKLNGHTVAKQTVEALKQESPPMLAQMKKDVQLDPTVLPARFGGYGGQYVPEALFDCLIELEDAHKAAIADPAFWKEFQNLYGYMNRPSKLYHADRMTEVAGGAHIWLKREDL